MNRDFSLVVIPCGHWQGIYPVLDIDSPPEPAGNDDISSDKVFRVKHR
jgi:hypothetical protein